MKLSMPAISSLPKTVQPQKTTRFKGSMTDPMHPDLEEAAKKSATNAAYSTMHNDDELAYQSIKRLAIANQYEVPTFEQVKYQRNLEKLRKSNNEAMERYKSNKQNQLNTFA